MSKIKNTDDLKRDFNKKIEDWQDFWNECEGKTHAAQRAYLARKGCRLVDEINSIAGQIRARGKINFPLNVRFNLEPEQLSLAS